MFKRDNRTCETKCSFLCCSPRSAEMSWRYIYIHFLIEKLINVYFFADWLPRATRATVPETDWPFHFGADGACRRQHQIDKDDLFRNGLGAKAKIIFIYLHLLKGPGFLSYLYIKSNKKFNLLIYLCNCIWKLNVLIKKQLLLKWC